ncbi:MAG: LemA family protein [Lachnospiraceae bacterium]|nr:LemA family protein [Lachnospiraceae bacterium]
MTGIFVIVAIVVLVVLWFISVQRMLVSLDENVNNAMSQIGVNLTSRFDALTGLLDLVKGYNEHEYKTLSDVIKMRTTIGSHSTASQVEAQENMITEAMGKIMAVAEAYPDLKSNTNYQNLMNSLNDYETKVRQSRLVYNDAVTKLNRTIRMFPTSLVAPMCGIVARDYLQTDSAKADMPSMK